MNIIPVCKNHGFSGCPCLGGQFNFGLLPLNTTQEIEDLKQRYFNKLTEYYDVFGQRELIYEKALWQGSSLKFYNELKNNIEKISQPLAAESDLWRAYILVHDDFNIDDPKSYYNKIEYHLPWRARFAINILIKELESDENTFKSNFEAYWCTDATFPLQYCRQFRDYLWTHRSEFLKYYKDFQDVRGSIGSFNFKLETIKKEIDLLYADITSKIEQLPLDPVSKEQMKEEVEKILPQFVRPNIETKTGVELKAKGNILALAIPILIALGVKS